MDGQACVRAVSGDARVLVPFRGFRGLQDRVQRGFEDVVDVSFQSPSGVLGVCRVPITCGGRHTEGGVSVPFRGFRGLQGILEELLKLIVQQRFQSPSGVLGVCRIKEARSLGVRWAVFQSPSGVLGVCRLSAAQTQRRSPEGRFSPLPGF